MSEERLHHGVTDVLLVRARVEGFDVVALSYEAKPQGGERGRQRLRIVRPRNRQYKVLRALRVEGPVARFVQVDVQRRHP